MTEKEQLWYTRFLDYANSGLSRNRWCQEHNIAQSTFRYWCKKFTENYRTHEPQESLITSTDQWFEISCRQDTAVPCQETVEYADTIRLQLGELKMEFPAGIEPRSLLHIAKGLMRS